MIHPAHKESSWAQVAKQPRLFMCGVNPVLSLIRGYRRVTVWLRSAQVPGLTYTTCKYQPSCSEYAELAVQKYGAVKGSLKAFGRILRCNPFASGGVDYP